MGQEKIGFVGGGNMTTAIAGGLVASGKSPEQIHIAEPDAGQRKRLLESLPGIEVSDDNRRVALESDCVVLAVKPDVLRQVCLELAAALPQRKPLFVSIAAGVRSSRIDSWLGGGFSVVRAMPNQPALLQLGVSALCADPGVSEPARELAENILAAVGTVVWVEDESDIDVVTAVSGSGPAYFYLLMDMLMKSAVAMGIDEAAARSLAIGTASGAAALAAQSDEEMEELIARVSSAGGTTAAALDSLEKQNVRAIFAAALEAAKDRAVALADEAGK